MNQRSLKEWFQCFKEQRNKRRRKKKIEYLHAQLRQLFQRTYGHEYRGD